MSIISRIKDNSNPVSSSDLESYDDSFLRSGDSFTSSQHIKSFGRAPRPMPVKEFRQSLENEKNIRQLMGRIDSLDISGNGGNDRIADVVERNYKLQIQTLLEEVNKLKLEKKIAEKRVEGRERTSLLEKSKRASELSSAIDDAGWKLTLESKNSTIKELEFQVSQFKKENILLKTRLEAQIRQIDELFQRLADSENLKDILEEKEQEIAELKDLLETEETKNERVLQELSNMRNENIAWKLRSQNTSFALPPTGATSFLNGGCNCSSKDQSFLSVIDRNCHHKTPSDHKFFNGVFNLSDLNDEVKVASPKLLSHQRKISESSLKLGKEHSEGENNNNNVKNGFSHLRQMSVKVLSDYEQEIKNETKTDVKKDSKTLDRIIEVNKIKSYYIEAQNKRLLALINEGKGKDENSGDTIIEN